MQKLFQLIQLFFPLLLLIPFIPLPLLLFPFLRLLCSPHLFFFAEHLLFAVVVQLFLFPFKRFHLVHTVHLEGGYGAVVLRAIVRGEIETDESVERGGLREGKCLRAPDVFADKRPDLFPRVSSASGLAPAVRLPVLVLAADTDLHFTDDTAEELPYGDLDGVYADLVAELDDDPVFAGPAWREHVAVAGLVEERGGVLGEGRGGVDPRGAVGGGVVVFAVVRGLSLIHI